MDAIKSTTGKDATTIGNTSISVVICAYTDERWDDIVTSIASVRAQEPAPDQVLLVIDHNPALQDRARSFFPSDVQVIENIRENGLSGARNCGVAAATGDVVAFLDDDAAARPGWMARMKSLFSDGATAGIGGGAAPRWPSRRPLWWPQEFDWVVGCSYTGLPTTIAEIRNPIGCNMAFRRAELVDAGGFDAGLGRIGKVPLGCEETELSIRIRRHAPASRIVLDPSMVVDHRVTLQRTTLKYFRARCWAEGLSKAFVREIAGAESALSSERAYVSRVLPRAVVTGVLQPPFGWARSAAILFGLTVTVLGYAFGTIKLRVAPVQVRTFSTATDPALRRR